jgi:hypothetical protein
MPSTYALVEIPQPLALLNVLPTKLGESYNFVCTVYLMAQLFNGKDPLSFFLSPANSLERAVAHPEAVLLPAIGIPLSVAHNLPFFISHYTGHSGYWDCGGCSGR